LEGSTPREMAAKGLFLPVDDALRGLRFTPADVTEMTYKGKMYAAPFFTTTRGLLKRVDAFAESGLDANADPTSMAQLKAWSDKLTVRNSDGTYKRVGFIPWGTNWGAPGWMWSFGGELVDASGIHPTATDPNNVRAFEWLREWAQPFNGKSPVPAGAGGFQNGTIAMNTDSTSAVGRLVNAKVNFTTGPVPHDAAGSNGTWGGGQAFAIPVNAAHPVEAMQFLRYMNTPEVQIARFKQFPQLLPANWDALQAIAPDLPAVYGPMLAQFPEARARTPLWIDYYVNQLRPAVTAVITGKKTPQQALADVQQVMVQRYKDVFGE
ncbi:MAG TPA: extracellular solute-binding protein, partial [Limnochordia bacterium]|nr:extracellular solute-binding protein [Limnochordia bacterium]